MGKLFKCILVHSFAAFGKIFKRTEWTKKWSVFALVLWQMQTRTQLHLISAVKIPFLKS